MLFHFKFKASLVLITFFILIAIGAVRIILTYDVFSQTWDEPAHIACGMEWLEQGSYTYEAQHPPLARIAVAIGPYLSGIRALNQKRTQNDYKEWIIWRNMANSRMWEEGNEILHANSSYSRNLALARLGMLPFFLLATVIVWIWSQRLFGRAAGLMATILFTNLPSILAHSGLATTDMAVAAT